MVSVQVCAGGGGGGGVQGCGECITKKTTHPPGGQFSHASCPSALVNVPAGQLSHAAELLRLANEPRPQLKHAPIAGVTPVLKVPVGHGRHGLARESDPRSIQ